MLGLQQQQRVMLAGRNGVLHGIAELTTPTKNKKPKKKNFDTPTKN
jgi:hypothetical protein